LAFIVISAGLPRSGSTWQFNAARLILDQAGTKYYAAWVKDYDPTRPEPVHLIKAHQFRTIPAHYDKIIYSHRKIEECLASLMRVGWLPETASAVKQRRAMFRKMHWKWLLKAHARISYRNLKRQPGKMVQTIGKALGHPLTTSEADSLAVAIDALGSKTRKTIDQVTQLRPDHRSDGSYQEDYLARVRALLREK